MTDEQILGALVILCACGWCYAYIRGLSYQDEIHHLRLQLTTMTMPYIKMTARLSEKQANEIRQRWSRGDVSRTYAVPDHLLGPSDYQADDFDD